MTARINLMDYLVNGDKPNGPEEDWSWSAGDQLKALRFYLSPAVSILAQVEEDDWAGNVVAVLQVNGLFFLWRDSFGSCCGCDSLDGENGYEYIKAAIAEGNSKQFDSLDEAEKYLDETDDWLWRDVAEMAREAIAKARDTTTP